MPSGWLDRDGDGRINYFEFISAFRVSPAGAEADEAAAAAADESLGTVVLDQLLEHLCALFYRHRWSLKVGGQRGYGRVEPTRVGSSEWAV